MLAMIGDQEIEIEPEEDEEEIVECNTITLTDQIELSSKSIHDFSSPKTMKVRGTIHDHPIIVLIDCGATHNFLSDTMVNIL